MKGSIPFVAGIDSLQVELGKQESTENNNEGARRPEKTKERRKHPVTQENVGESPRQAKKKTAVEPMHESPGKWKYSPNLSNPRKKQPSENQKTQQASKKPSNCHHHYACVIDPRTIHI